MPKNELKEAYSGCDLFLFPSYEETEGIVVLEALAMKIPLLIRDIPVYADWLQSGYDVYKAKSLDEFETIAKDILSDSYADITEYGYKTIGERSIVKTGKQLINVYKRCLSKSPFSYPISVTADDCITSEAE